MNKKAINLINKLFRLFGYEYIQISIIKDINIRSIDMIVDDEGIPCFGVDATAKDIDHEWKLMKVEKDE